MALQNDKTEFWDFSSLSYGQIENIYQNIKLDGSPIVVVSVLIAMLIAVINLVQVAVKEVDIKDDGIPIGAILAMFKEKWKFFLILMLMPIAFSIAEAFFGSLSDFYTESLKEPEGNAFDKMAEQLLQIQEKESKESSWWKYSAVDLIDYIITLGIQPFVVMIDQWTYSIAIMYKFFFQGILELTSSLAVAFLLNDKTQQFFYSWLKAVKVCYMLIPVFLIANYFVNSVSAFVIKNSIQGEWIFQTVVLFTAVKIILFASGKVILWRIF